MEEKKQESRYDELKKKHKLPEFDDLDRDFQIRGIEPEADHLREIFRRMYDTMDFYAKLLEDIIQPDARLSTMQEAAGMNAQQKALVESTHVRIMKLLRRMLSLNVEYSEKLVAAFVADAFKEWQPIKKDLKAIADTLTNTWSSESKSTHDGGYFG